MKPRRFKEMIRAKELIERGLSKPGKVWEIHPDEKGAFAKRPISPRTFQRPQKKAWDKSIAGTRNKLGLSQSRFARLLGISVRALHHWEQGRRTPSGAARVLLRVAALDPDVVLKAAAWPSSLVHALRTPF